jgi:predicted MFS family arabinose efflux permease
MALAGPLTVFVAENTNWRASYALLGGLAALAWIASFLLAEPLPSSGQEGAKNLSRHREDTSSVLRSVGLVAAGFLLYNMAKSFYSTWFPTILVKEYGFTSMEAAQVTFYQSLAAPAASLLLAAASVFLLKRRYSILFSRCLPLTFGFAVGGAIVTAYWLPNSIATISLLAFVGLISTSALIWNSVPDNIDPVDVGTTAGWVNAISNIGSVLGPLVVGYLLQSSRDHVLAFVSIACLLAAPSFLLAYFFRRKSSISA